MLTACGSGAARSRSVSACAAMAQGFYERGIRLVPGRLERRLKVGDQARPELRVGLRPLDDLVEPAPGERQLLGGLDPTLGRRRQRSEKLRDVLFVVVSHRTPDGSGTDFLPSNLSRSFSRQREIRLAIVPAGRSSASPIVR